MMIDKLIRKSKNIFERKIYLLTKNQQMAKDNYKHYTKNIYMDEDGSLYVN